jgi:ketosteroid isomerase-like protein
MKDFGTDFKTFMQALATKDRDTFETFLDKETYSFAILPPSRTFDTLASYRASQEHWFEGKIGSFTYTITLAEEVESMAFGVVRAVYKNVGDDGKPFSLELWISFIFKKLGHGWKMVFVQNTQIQS